MRSTGPRYLAVEGVDGAGKTTQIRALAEEFVKRNITPIQLAEPTYGRYGREIRAFSNSSAAPPTVARQIELFTADRMEHVRLKVRPLLEFVRSRELFLILQDRYYLSAPAYQATSRGEMVNLLRAQQKIAPMPDVSILLDVPTRVALQRLEAREALGSFEQRNTLDEVRARFSSLADEGSEPVVKVDGEGTVAEVTGRILNAIDARQES